MLKKEVFSVGEWVRFWPGPRSKEPVVAEIRAIGANSYLITVDALEKRRKVRESAVSRAAAPKPPEPEKKPKRPNGRPRRKPEIEPEPISGAEFDTWRRAAGLTKVDAGRVLGRKDDAVTRFCREGIPAGDTRLVRLAMAAVLRKVRPYRS